ncbi:MAG: PQQ-binding-like beta-propeller repeat protein [Acidimicrobiales bacterium]
MGDVYFGTVVGHVYGFGPDGRRLFDFDTGATVDSYPALGGDGTLYIGSANGTLYAF